VYREVIKLSDCIGWARKHYDYGFESRLGTDFVYVVLLSCIVLRVGGWMDPRAGLDTPKKNILLPLPGIEPGLFGHPAHSLPTIPTEPSKLISDYFLRVCRF
jgi:hypothetical protein